MNGPLWVLFFVVIGAIEGELPCENDECIPESWFCDGEIDCEDSSDEFCPDCKYNAQN